jgi:hypothetical protein
MATVPELLRSAGIACEPFAGKGSAPVMLTSANQLVGTFGELAKFRQGNRPNYDGWHRHHVVEDQDLTALQIAATSPPYEDQLCVLLPERAHIGRINSVLRRYAPSDMVLTPRDRLKVYASAYETMGDYCGGGERLVRRELVAIVEATFRAFNLL